MNRVRVCVGSTIMSKIAALLLNAALASCTLAESAADGHGRKEIAVRLSPQAKENWSVIRYETPEVYELASIIVSLSPHGRTQSITPENKDARLATYANDVRAHFDRFANHPAVKAVDAIDEPNNVKLFEFRENAFAFRFDAHGSIVPTGLTPYVWGQTKNRFSLNLSLVKQFAKDSNFRAFYERHRPFYARLHETDAKALDISAMRTWLEARFPKRVEGLIIAYSPLTNGWHSTQGFYSDDFDLAVMFVEPGLPEEEAKPWVIAQMVFTEIDHNYVNPISGKFIKDLNHRKSFESRYWTRNGKGVPGYSSGYATFNEYMTFALFELFAEETFPPKSAIKAATSAADTMERRGFNRYRKFVSELRRLFSAAQTKSGKPVQMETLYPALIKWGEDRVSASELDPD